MILGYQEHLHKFDQIFDALQIIQIQSGWILRREDVREIDHIDSDPILLLFRGTGKFVQHVVVVFFHFNDIVVEIVHVRMGAAKSAHAEIWTRRSASVQGFVLSHRVVLAAQTDAPFYKMHPLRRSISAGFDAAYNRVAGHVVYADVEHTRRGCVTVRRRKCFRYMAGRSIGLRVTQA